MRNSIGRSAAMCGVCLLVSGLSQGALAQTTSGEQVSNVDEIIVTGARGRPRTVADSPVPIDSFSEADIEAVSHTDTNDLLQTLIPSYSVPRNSNQDGATFVRPATLRGLSGNKTLLLLNSRRRHRAAVVPEVADAALIPPLALRSVEVLRDGAAAQYGSDAIAGVINFILKDSSSGGAFTVQTGQYYEGDGADVLIAGNIGLPLGSRGFVNATVEYTQADPTSRQNQFSNASFDAIDYAASHPDYAAAVDLSKPLMRTGQPIMESVRVAVNSGLDVGENGKLYAFGTYADSSTSNDFVYRYPGNGQAINDNPIRLQDGRVFRFNELFPGGFTPEFTGDITDYSVVGGYRSKLGGLSYDLSVRYGKDEIAYSLTNTVNPSLGPDSPTSFKPGTLVSDEFAVNLDLGYDVAVSAFYSPVTFNFGGEYRDEGYEMKLGDPLSYAAGPFSGVDPFDFCAPDHTPNPGVPVDVGLNCANYLSGTADGFAGIDPVYTTLEVGSSGFPGYAPAYTGQFGRDSYSIYGEATTDVTDRLFIDLAVRYEDYSDFGDTLNGKAAFLFKLTPSLNLRGSVGTGFRAPSTGQLYSSNVRTAIIDGNIFSAGLFPATHPVSVFLGAVPLRPEESINYSVGFTARLLEGLTLTADAYYIGITDQVASTSSITVTEPIRAQLIEAGVIGAATLSRVNFYQNAFDANTTGLDVVANYSRTWNNGQRTTLTASFNYNKYELDEVHIEGLYNDVSRFNFSNSTPPWRSVFVASHDIGAFSVLGRATVYGGYEVQRNLEPTNPIQEYGAEVMFDLEASYQVDENYRFSVGARNIFDNYPDEDAIGLVTNGTIYRDGPVSWQGGYYYARLQATF